MFSGNTEIGKRRRCSSYFLKGRLIMEQFSNKIGTCSILVSIDDRELC